MLQQGLQNFGGAIQCELPMMGSKHLRSYCVSLEYTWDSACSPSLYRAFCDHNWMISQGCPIQFIHESFKVFQSCRLILLSIALSDSGTTRHGCAASSCLVGCPRWRTGTWTESSMHWDSAYLPKQTSARLSQVHAWKTDRVASSWLRDRSNRLHQRLCWDCHGMLYNCISWEHDRVHHSAICQHDWCRFKACKHKSLMIWHL